MAHGSWQWPGHLDVFSATGGFGDGLPCGILAVLVPGVVSRTRAGEHPAPQQRQGGSCPADEDGRAKFVPRAEKETHREMAKNGGGVFGEVPPTPQTPPHKVPHLPVSAARGEKNLLGV